MLCETTYHIQPNPILEPILCKSRVNIGCNEQGRLDENIGQYCMNQISEIRYYFCEISKEGKYSIMISIKGNQNIPTSLLRHNRKHRAIEYCENISKGLLKKSHRDVSLGTWREHTLNRFVGRAIHI